MCGTPAWETPTPFLGRTLFAKPLTFPLFSSCHTLPWLPQGDMWELCGQTGTYPARGTVVFDGGLNCHVTSLVNEVCAAGTASLLMAKLDTYGYVCANVPQAPRRMHPSRTNPSLRYYEHTRPQGRLGHCS